MLDELSVKILEHLKTYFSQDNPTFYRSDRLKKEITNYSVAEIKACLIKLSDDGFIGLTDMRDPIIIVNRLTHDGYNYENHLTKQTSLNYPVFNIGSVQNSAFGNSGDVTINNGLSFSELKDFIKTQNIPESDKDILLELTDCVEDLISNDIPLEKGSLSKFSSVLKDYGSLAFEIIKTFIPYFFGLPS